MRRIALIGVCAAFGAVLVTGAQGAFPGRNGKIVFVRQTHGPGGTLDVTPAIYVVNPDYTGLTSLTDPATGAYDTSPSWSPDGKKIAFVRLVRGVPTYGDAHELFVMNADGSGVLRMTRNALYDDHPSWSPDGKWIAFARQDRAGPELGDVSFDIWVMGANGTGAKQLTRTRREEVNPAWSPNGKLIAFLVDDPKTAGARILVMSTDGSGSKLVARVPVIGTSIQEEFSIQRPSWSPDGKRIAFVGGKGITTSRPDGTGLTVLPAGLHPSWSPDGKSLTFTRFDPGSQIGRIYVMDADGTNLRALTSAMYPLDDQQPDWQPVSRTKGGVTP